MLNYLNDENKMLVFNEDHGGAAVTLTLQVPECLIDVDISAALQFFEGDKTAYAFRVFDPQSSQYVELPENCLLPLHYFFSPIVMFKYRQPVEPQSTQQVERRERNQQRTIRQVISAVKRWRSYRCTQESTQPKVRLEEAARLVGIAKKSLDDYFGQLRLGELYGFNFKKNLEKKFGMLRAFVKKHKERTSKSTHNMKYPKRLRIMQSLDDSSQVPPSNKQEQSPTSTDPSLVAAPTLPSPERCDEPSTHRSTPMEKLQQDEYENQFYRCYELLLNEPKDPFVPFAARDYREYRNWRDQQEYSF